MNESGASASSASRDGRRPRRLYASNATYAYLLSLTAIGTLGISVLLGRVDPFDDPIVPLAIVRRVARFGEMFVPVLGLVAVFAAWSGVDQIRRRPRLFGRRRAAIAIALGFASIVVPFAAEAGLFLLSGGENGAGLVTRAAVPLALFGALAIHPFLSRRFPSLFPTPRDLRSSRLRDIQRGLFPHRRGTPFEGAFLRDRARASLGASVASSAAGPR